MGLSQAIRILGNYPLCVASSATSGLDEAVDFLIEGLRRLEYRGYDSTGVVTIDDGGFAITKTAGRIDELAPS